MFLTFTTGIILSLMTIYFQNISMHTLTKQPH